MAGVWKRLGAILLIGAVTAAVVAATAMRAPEKQSQSGGGRRGKGMEGPVPVLAAQATKAIVPVYLEGIGTARALNTVTVRPQVDGKILRIAFTEGQEVKKGDLLATIDATTFQAQLDQVSAKKSLSEAQLANAKRDLERYARLNTSAVSEKTVDTQRALVAQFEAQVKLDQAAIDNARAVLDYANVTAPIEGRTGLRLVDEGNLVRSGDAGIVVIAQLKPISVVFTMPQQQLHRVNVAMQSGGVGVDALQSDHATVLDQGRLLVVDNQVDQATGTVRMKAEFPNAEMKLWPGQFVNVRLLIDMLKDVVTVPTAALQQGPTGSFVYSIGADQKVAVRPVTVVQQSDTVAVIATGLEAGEQVVTSGFARLQPGASVRLPGAEPGSQDGEPNPAAGPGSGGKGAATSDAGARSPGTVETGAAGQSGTSKSQSLGSGPGSGTPTADASQSTAGQASPEEAKPKDERRGKGGKRKRRESADEAQ